MSLQEVTAVEPERASAMDAADVEALAELYRTPTGAMPEWCDLTPEPDITPDGNDGFATVRI